MLAGGLDEIRKEFVTYKNQHLGTLSQAGLSDTEALKDWQDNFKRILDAMDCCTKEIRSIVLKEK